MRDLREVFYNVGVQFGLRRCDKRMRMQWFGPLLLLSCIASIQPAANGQTQVQPSTTQTSRTFGEKDAQRVMEGIRKSFEANNRTRLIGLFDSKRMPEFATFRDQVSQLFVQYESFQVRYHMKQVSQDGEFGSIIAEFVLQAFPVSDRQPDLRRRAQLHVIVAWDGTAWKIADVSPRTVFQ